MKNKKKNNGFELANDVMLYLKFNNYFNEVILREVVFQHVTYYAVCGYIQTRSYGIFARCWQVEYCVNESGEKVEDSYLIGKVFDLILENLK